MTVIKRCEKEVLGSWADKQQQAKKWLAHFVPHYSRRCLPDAEDRCPASHSAVDDDGKRWLDSGHAADVGRIAQLEQLVERMRADVTLYVHGYNTCAVECAHGERTVHTSKRVEYWSSWEGRCQAGAAAAQPSDERDGGVVAPAARLAGGGRRVDASRQD